MGIGSVLVGLGVAILVSAYLVRPFRKGKVDLDRAIETWVGQIRSGERTESAGDVNHCPRCGRRVSSDDRFCSRCGTRLQGGTG
jgi:hypothetical protein